MTAESFGARGPALVLVGLSALFVWKGPYARVAAGIRSGEFSGHAIPVGRFEPPTARLGAERITLGRLRVWLPGSASRRFNEAGSCVTVFAADYRGLLCAPRPDGLPPFRAVLGPGASRELADCDEIDLRTAAYAAGVEELSFNMAADDVRNLAQKLRMKEATSHGVTRAEIIDHAYMKGIVLIFEHADTVYTVFEFMRPDGALAGTAMFCADRGETDAVDQVRAIIGSMRFQ
jgi:hypothetical protein